MKIKYFFLFFVALGLAGCQTSQPATPAITTTLPAPTTTPTSTLSAPVQATKNASPTFDFTSEALTNPPPTPTGTPIVDTDGNVTWHPQKVLISWNESPNDGNSAYTNPNFVLYWDGTLLQPAYDSSGDSIGPSTSKLNQEEICKVLNTVESSGFFEEPNDYSFPFAGGWSSYIDVNSWKSNWSGAQQLYYAIRGETYYNQLFCRDCPIPSAKTIIRPALANTYYFLQNYVAENSHPAQIKKWHVSFYASEEKSNRTWPLTSISFDQFMEKCHGNICFDSGMEIDGALADEFIQKIEQDQPYPWKLSDDYPSVKMYVDDIWPEESDIPADATLTCNTKSPTYPILPLNPANKFWYYAPGGKWGAEVVAGENKIRIVNTSGYEKFYGYDAAFFGQPSIQFYPRFWSADEQFFYVNVLPADFKPGDSLVNSIGLQQIDVKNEKIKYIFLGSAGQTFAYQFSHSGNEIVYIRQGDQPLKLVVVDTYSGEERSVSLTTRNGTPYSDVRALYWSLKDDKLFLSTTFTDGTRQKGQILSIQLDKLANLQIIKESERPFTISDSFGSDYIEICGDSGCATLDFETGAIK